jgi:hypothetical protein
MSRVDTQSAIGKLFGKEIVLTPIVKADAANAVTGITSGSSVTTSSTRAVKSLTRSRHRFARAGEDWLF